MVEGVQRCEYDPPAETSIAGALHVRVGRGCRSIAGDTMWAQRDIEHQRRVISGWVETR